jgi:predicted dehydrogenase
MNDNIPTSDFNRRDFLKGGSLATVMTMLGGIELIAQTTNASAEARPNGPKVRVAVIGLGTWGRDIVKTLGRAPQAEIVAICDTYAASLRKCAPDAPGAKQASDYKELLADKSVQAVIVATPPHLHREVVIEALKAGKHVYCEAPLANSIEDARAIALAANAAPMQVFQAGLQMRSDPQRHFLLPFVRSGALGTSIMARAQWHKKQSWRSASPNPDREKALNWRLSRETSTGLIGEIGIHQVDQAGWFLKGRPLAVTGFNSLIHWKDGRDVPDTIHAIFEYADGVRLAYDATLANSFDADYEIYYGTYAAVMMRESKAWMFKEVDSPLLGWEVYAKKEQFYNETGIALMAGASKQESFTEKKNAAALLTSTPLYHALGNFLFNVFEQETAIQNFTEAFGADDPAALMEHLKAEVEPKRKPGATALEGFHATVTAIKANEAILNGGRLEFKDEWYQLS